MLHIIEKIFDDFVNRPNHRNIILDVFTWRYHVILMDAMKRVRWRYIHKYFNENIYHEFFNFDLKLIFLLFGFKKHIDEECAKFVIQCPNSGCQFSSARNEVGNNCIILILHLDEEFIKTLDIEQRPSLYLYHHF